MMLCQTLQSMHIGVTRAMEDDHNVASKRNSVGSISLSNTLSSEYTCGCTQPTEVCLAYSCCSHSAQLPCWQPMGGELTTRLDAYHKLAMTNGHPVTTDPDVVLLMDTLQPTASPEYSAFLVAVFPVHLRETETNHMTA